MLLKNILNLYKKNYRKLLIIPILFFLFSIFIISQTISSEGVPIYRDISLKGGLSVILNVDTQTTQKEFEDYLRQLKPQDSFKVSEVFEEGLRTGFVIDTSMDEKEFIDILSNYFKKDFVIGENYSSNFISPSLSNSFFKQAMVVLLVSFILMSIVIFVAFRQFVPSFAVVLSAFFDLIVTVGILDLMKFEISIAGIGALLMLIGYSIDTDVLLTNRLYKEFGENYFEKLADAFKTGILMTSTTLVAGVGALFFTNSDVIFEIALILVLGLVVDFISTWLQNTGILLWWLEHK